MSEYELEFLALLLLSVISFGIGTLLIGMNPIINKYSEKLSIYVGAVGIAISIISIIGIASSIMEYIVYFL